MFKMLELLLVHWVVYQYNTNVDFTLISSSKVKICPGGGRYTNLHPATTTLSEEKHQLVAGVNIFYFILSS